MKHRKEIEKRFELKNSWPWRELENHFTRTKNVITWSSIHYLTWTLNHPITLHTDTHQFTFTLTPWENLASPVDLTIHVFGLWEKTNTERMCKLHIERPWMGVKHGTLVPWEDSAASTSVFTCRQDFLSKPKHILTCDLLTSNLSSFAQWWMGQESVCNRCWKVF